MSKFAKNLSDLLRARFPCIYISTWEEERLLCILEDICSDKDIIRTPRNLFTWKLTEGLSEKRDEIVPNTKDPIQALDFIQNYDLPGLFVLLDFHIFFGYNNQTTNFEVIRRIRDSIKILTESENPKNIIIVAPSIVIPNEIEKDITIVDFELPSFDEIKSLLREIIEINNGNGLNIELNPDEEEKIAKAALGLTLKEAENTFAHAMVDDKNLNIKDISLIQKEKSQLIKKTGILEFIESSISIDEVGGLENLKNWLLKRNNSWLDLAKRYNIPSPKGVLITGVPGCGKSLIAKSISSMWNLPLLRLDISKIFSGIVGSSEENMRKAINTAEAISPCILWIDEIEKGFSSVGSTGDSGVSSRVFGTFLTWMQEKSKPVFVVATANKIDLLPPEMLRKGRFDEIFFVDLPTKKEREEIFRVHSQRYLDNPDIKGDCVINEDLLTHISEMTEGFGGAEIENVVVSSLFEAFSEKRSIKLDDFEKSIDETIPLSVTQSEQIIALRQWAKLRAVTATAQKDRESYEDSIITEEPKKDNLDEEIFKSRGGRKLDF